MWPAISWEKENPKVYSANKLLQDTYQALKIHKKYEAVQVLQKNSKILHISLNLSKYTIKLKSDVTKKISSVLSREKSKKITTY